MRTTAFTARGAAAIVSGLAACASVDAGPASSLPTATPAAIGLSAPRLEYMREYFHAEVDRHTASGYVLMVARDGKLAYATAIGTQDCQGHRPMQLGTRFRIASMTKPVTAVAVLMLYEEGRFQLDDPVSRFLPEFSAARVYTGVDAEGRLASEPARAPITIRQLLTHTAGLGYPAGAAAGTPLGKALVALHPEGPGTLADKIRDLAGLPLFFEPGAAWQYGPADDVLGRLVEVVSGMPFEQFLKSRLFDPLGMPHTGFYLAQADLPQLAEVCRRTPAGTLEISDLPLASPTDRSHWASGGAGLLSTAADYLLFAQMLANGGSLGGKRYLSPVTVGLMSTNQVAIDAYRKYWGASAAGQGYGLGVAMLVDAASAPHAGFAGDISWGGFLDTHWVVSPRTGIAAVLLAQVDPRGATLLYRTDPDFRNLLFATVERLAPAGAEPGR